MTNLGGHCYETLFDAFAYASQTDNRTCFLAYTIKGYGLPLAGHRDNHGLYLSPDQITTLRGGETPPTRATPDRPRHTRPSPTHPRDGGGSARP